MYSTKYTNFLYSREISILELSQISNFPIQHFLNIKVDNFLLADNDIIIGDEYFGDISKEFDLYLTVRSLYFKNSKYLFPAINGQKLQYSKFVARLTTLAKESGIKLESFNPHQVTKEQISSLRNQRFKYQRQDYQIWLAVFFTSLMGFRPSEVAKLIKKDIGFSSNQLELRDTKSKKDQYLPIPNPMIKIIKNYVNHLSAPDDPLFVRLNGNQWNRKRVTESVQIWAKTQGVKSHVTSQKLRATFGKNLSELKVPPAKAAQMMRHKDFSTWYENYVHYYSDELQDGFDQIYTQSNTDIGDDNDI
ncbi:MAG: site-specific integrase [Chloroflexota bacterium]|nr:site-specific integrase [Chloroflexota bacterium]